MLSRLFGKKGQIVVATINARILPMTRGEFLEDPLDQILKKTRLGKVCGGGTALLDSGDGVSHVDIEIELKDLSQPNLTLLLEILNDLGNPKGSYLTLPDESQIAFGQFEGLEMMFEAEDMADAFAGRLMEDDSSPHHYGDFGAGGRSLNLYGPSFAEMEAFCRTKLVGETVTITQIA